MIKTNTLLSTIVVGASMLVLSGCMSSSPRLCSSNDTANGYFCHKGYNFGKDKSRQFKSGVRDGCRTARGYFTKDYTVSSWSKDYIDGWNAGRTRCRHEIPTAAQPGMRTEYQQGIDEKQYYGN